MKPVSIVLLVLSFGFLATRGSAAEPSWTTKIIKRGEDRAVTNATPITQRPNRPFHFYGNTVRRVYYRGAARPTLGDIRNTFVFALRR